MPLALLYVGLIDFSYAEDLANNFSELTGIELAEENMPILLAQEKSTTGNYEFQEPYDSEVVKEIEKEEADDDNGTGVGLERRKHKRKNKGGRH
jgi:hypothetical protein